MLAGTSDLKGLAEGACGTATDQQQIEISAL
jgi:hypothetical protein